MKKWQGIVLASVGAGIAGLSAVIRRLNRVEMIDPATLVMPQTGDRPVTTDGLEGVINFRDVGGYPTASGGRVRTGLVYRSGALHNLTAADLERLHGLNIKLVCDLRSEEERAAEPDTLPANPGPTYLHLPLTGEDERRRRLMAVLFNRRQLAGMMREFYVQTIIERNARLYGDMLRRFADPANLPAIIHCTAGKDRTGVGVALLLRLLGVAEETVLADYSLSNQHYEHFLAFGRRAVEPIAWLRVKAEDLQPLFLADPDNLRAVFAHIHERYGTVENYLREAAGVDDETQAGLRAVLVEGAVHSR